MHAFNSIWLANSTSQCKCTCRCGHTHTSSLIGITSATVDIADTVGPQVGIIIVVVDVFDETLPYDISTLEGAFEVIA